MVNTKTGVEHKLEVLGQSIFTIAFSAAFAFAGPSDSFALETAPLMGVFHVDTMRWISWALGDLSVKLIIAVVALIPYRLLAARWSQPALAA
jgi:uncharacterized PurR-regulated membrane protein YhhQ (DUF165 family)